MKLEGTYLFEAPRDVTWEALLDPEVLARTMPGCEKLDKIGDNEYRGTLKIRVGPVQGQFEGTVTISDMDPPNSYRMHINGRGAPGYMSGEGEVHLEDQGDQTLMHYSGEAQVGGRVASVGQRLLETSARALTRQSLDGLHEQIKARLEAQEQETPPPPVKAPSQLRFATGVTRTVVADLVPRQRYPIVAALGLLVLAIILYLALRPSSAAPNDHSLNLPL